MSRTDEGTVNDDAPAIIPERELFHPSSRVFAEHGETQMLVTHHELTQGDTSVYSQPFFSSPNLAFLGLRYHTGLKVLVCEECKEGVRAMPTSVKNHISKAHRARSKVATPTKITQALNEVPEAHQLSHPILPLASGQQRIPLVDGLGVQRNCFACCECR